MSLRLVIALYFADDRQGGKLTFRSRTETPQGFNGYRSVAELRRALRSRFGGRREVRLTDVPNGLREEYSDGVDGLRSVIEVTLEGEAARCCADVADRDVSELLQDEEVCP